MPPPQTIDSLIPSWVALRPFSAELWLILTIVAELLTPFFVRGRRTNLACALIALVGISMALLSLLVVGSGGGVNFQNLLIADPAAICWKCILLLFVAGVIVLQIGGPIAELHPTDGPEFYTLLLGSTLGMCLMGSTVNLMMIFIAVELTSLPSYVLAGFRKQSRLGGEASLKYVLFGATATAVMAYGLSLLYGLGGTLNGAELASALVGALAASPLLWLAMLAVLVGFGFKIAAVPFHFWCPDVFQGAGLDVTTFLSVASKGAGLMLLMRFVQTLAAVPIPSQTLLTGIAIIIGVLATVTMTLGNTAAFVQKSVKRLLAYSSIAQAGYILALASLLVPSVGQPVSDRSNAATSTLLLYLAIYAVMNLGAFAIAGAVAAPRSDDVTLDDFRGLGRRSPMLAAAMFACLVSLIGLPPLAGFGAKIAVLWALVQNGGWWWALAAAVVINTIISAFYYFRIIRVMYLDAQERPERPSRELLHVLGGVCAILLLGMFFAFGRLSTVMNRYGRMLTAPGATMPAEVSAAPSAPAAASATIASAAR